MPYVNYQHFQKDLNFQIEESVPYSHIVQKGTLTTLPNHIWFSKECFDHFDAYCEQIGQNFFNLILSSPQPLTLIALDFTEKKLFCLSEEVSGFNCLPHDQHSKFVDQSFKNFPQILLLSHFLEEIDLKNGNVGLDNDNYVVKIDGDMYFGSLKTDIHYQRFAITTDSISKLPEASSFYTYNWLDIVKSGKTYPISHIIDLNISQNQAFQVALSQAILRICLLPKGFILEFLHNHLQPIGDFFNQSNLRYFFNQFTAFFLSRQILLRKAAFHYEPFKHYMFSEYAQQDIFFLTQQFSNPNLFTPQGMIPTLHNYRKGIKKLEENIFEFRLHFFPLIQLARTNIQLFLKSLHHLGHWPELVEFANQHLKHISSLDDYQLKGQNLLAIMDTLHYINRIQELKLGTLDREIDLFCYKSIAELNLDRHEFHKVQSLKLYLFNYFINSWISHQNIYLPIRNNLNHIGWWKFNIHKDKVSEFEEMIRSIPFEDRAKTLSSPEFIETTEQHLFQHSLFKPKLKNMLPQNTGQECKGFWV